jgi:mersacidin/lichenicidin family type 2 lantibiotic
MEKIEIGKTIDLLRALKDEEYRLSLAATEQVQLPASPIGGVQLTETELDDISGAGYTYWLSCTLTRKTCCLI